MSIVLNYTLVDLDEFHDRVLPELPGVPTSLANQAILEACIEFCKTTRLWKETVTINVVADDPSYAITPPGSAIFVEVRRAAYNDEDLTTFVPEEMDAKQPGWRDDTGVPQSYAVVDEDEILIYPTPSASLASGLVVDAVFQPTVSATQVPSFLRDRHMDAISKGAKAALMAMGKKPWTDRDLSMKYREDFQIAMSRAGWKHALGHTRQPARVATISGVK